MPTNRFLSALNAVGVLAVSVGLLGCSASSAAIAAPSHTPSPTLAASRSTQPASSPSSAQGQPASPLATLIPVPLGGSTPGSPLQAGARYVITDPFPVRLSFVAPSGWAGNIGGPYAVWTGPAATGDSLLFQANPKVFVDPCHPEQGTVAPSKSATVGDLVQAILSRPGLAKTTPTSATLGGLSATSFRLSVSGSLRDCSSGTYLLWELPLGATNELQTGMSERVSVVDVNGLPLVVLAVDAGDANQQQAIQQVLDSIQFEAP
jgi:hypothetical protein